MNRASVNSGTTWEKLASYARAVRIDQRILVSGTTATGPDGLVGGDDCWPPGIPKRQFYMELSPTVPQKVLVQTLPGGFLLESLIPA